ncbi:LysM peptidoglycan-binding domain-containing protein [Streptomyces sp. 130]|uniref:BTAD domain-containing putative transcriptional regulator n=1 Tax=Streptomyces sp. 130 TaxID=2591006 RepID=UPI00117E661E|nr:BTAD domain-containing putative transcriptional regulator [Streptomyces sp. 130]TRV81772.1 LysM peptidoglycan-binding domain-containing protein [Streptomyces sp. 130]
MIAVRTVGSLIRALLSLVVLAALLAGLPVLLWWATGVVLDNGIEDLTHLFSRQDTGGAFLLLLAAAGWVGWAGFAFSVLLEIPAQLRGRTVRRLSGLGASQRAAATLIGSILGLLPPAGAARAAPAAAPVSVTQSYAPAGATDTAHAPDARTTRQAAPADSYTVRDIRPAESLWSIAEDRLGDGNRWHEIATLNEGRVMTDGTVFHAQGFLQPGWQLRMPAGTGAAPEAAAPSGGTATVRPGDSLGAIADRELGDPARYGEIFDLNRGAELPGGGTFTNPDLIIPGQHLKLPAPAPANPAPANPGPGKPGPANPGPAETGKPDPAETARPAPAKPAETAKPKPAETAPAKPAESAKPKPAETGPAKPAESAKPKPAETGPAKPAESAKPKPAETGPAKPAETAKPKPAETAPAKPAESAKPGPAESAESAQPTPAADEDAGFSARTGAGIGALLAAGVLGVLGTRRIVQQRRRRPRRRIALPEGDAAALERGMRAASADVPEGLDLLDRALRTLSAELAREGTALPRLDAVVVTPDGAALHLCEPAAPVTPFVPVVSGDEIWWCPKDSGALLPAEGASATALPYPALISLGTSFEGFPVLVDLERIGMLRLDGETEDVRSVLLALAVELASDSLHAEHTVRLVGFGEELKTAFPGRVVHHATLASAVAGLRSHDEAQRRALAESGAESLCEARLLGTGADAWAPQIVLCALPLTGSDPSALDLLELTAAQPRTSLAAVTSADDGLGLPETWSVDTAPGVVVTIPETDLEVMLQRLEPAQYAALLELMAVTERPTDEPTPDWARPHDPRLTLAVMAAPEPEAAGDDGNPVRTASVEETITAPAPVPAHPYIRVLGPVGMESAEGPVESNRRGRLTEMAAWLVLHPGQEHRALDEAIWPGREVGHSLRNSNVSKLRAWTGGQSYLPFVTDGRYAFAPYVRCDWLDFQELYQEGMHARGAAADTALARALSLVRGTPFEGTNPRNYLWADALFHDIVSSVVDVAHELAERCLAAGDLTGAVAAATRGLVASPESELLTRDLFRAHAARGDRSAVIEAADRLNRLNEELGTDAEDETIDLLRDILKALPEAAALGNSAA